MELNNLYNFKNPVKHFLNIDSIKYNATVFSQNINELSWAEPIIFRVKKQENGYRTIRIPNIFNFICAYEHFKDMPNFEDIGHIDPSHKRLSANIETGDFVSGEYDRQLEEDLEKLCIFDNLLKLDIKDCYGRIYTHHIDMLGHNERFLTNMNAGGTNGLLLGNYISLYFAEAYLADISHEIERLLTRSGINCKFSYFSDDFYFFCNKNENAEVIKIFDKALEKFNFERNTGKTEVWSYETFNNYNLVSRYWKKTVAHSNIRFNRNSRNNKLYFINQIVYRMSKLQDEKLKKVFINNFFKTKYFKTLDLSNFEIRIFDYHQLGFLFKYTPEVLLYTIDKFSDSAVFDKSRLKEFFEVRYKESLKEPYNDEQLYYFYANKILGFGELLAETKNAVLETNNQILISYYLQDRLFDQDDINSLKNNNDESCWFQNYHLILYTDLFLDLENNITRYLMPKFATKPGQITSYFNFYNDNLSSLIPLIKGITNVNIEIQTYLDLKIAESEAIFADEINEENAEDINEETVDGFRFNEDAEFDDYLILD